MDRHIYLLIRSLFTPEHEYYKYSVPLSFKKFIVFLKFYFFNESIIRLSAFMEN